nr:AcaB family transcriptional regulator [Histophilus somni]
MYFKLLILVIFILGENYRHSGITRHDAIENNARYKAAIKRMKYELSPEILSGEKRANFAPVIKNTSSSDAEPEQDEFVEIGSA